MSEPKYKIKDRVLYLGCEFWISNIKTLHGWYVEGNRNLTFPVWPDEITYNIIDNNGYTFIGVPESLLFPLYDWCHQQGETTIKISEHVDFCVLSVKIGAYKCTKTITRIDVAYLRDSSCLFGIVEQVFEEAILTRYHKDIEDTTKELSRLFGVKD